MSLTGKDMNPYPSDTEDPAAVQATSSDEVQSNDNVVVVDTAVGSEDDGTDDDNDDNVATERHQNIDEFNEKPISIREQQARLWCCPHGVTKHSIPLFFSAIALAFTGVGSWDCSYFVGATTGFTGTQYGLWTLESKYGACQLWDVVFFSYSLGGYLIAARALSMTAMVLGLSLLTAMSQALQCHLMSWGVGLTLFVVFIASVSTTSQYNLWTLFFLFLYIILVLIVRALFIHPVHRVISSRGSKYIAWLLIVCFLCTILTLLVLKSYFCQCGDLSTERLEGRGVDGVCKLQCQLDTAGILMVIAAGMWLLSGLAVFRFGVQPAWYEGEFTSMYGDFTRDSITTKAKKRTKAMVDFSIQSPAMAASLVSRSLSPGESVKEPNADFDEDMEGGAIGGNPNGDAEETDNVIGDDDEEAGEIAQKSFKGSVNNAVNDENKFHRTWSQKLCCDYRVKKRSRKERWCFCCFRCGLAALVGIFIFIVVMLCGSRYEKMQAESAPSTTPNFVTNVTCAYNESDISAPFVTYNTPQEAAANNMTVAHCGNCSYCSNMEDIGTYVTTRETITIQAKSCGKTAVLGSTAALDACLEDRIGFTDECRTCWVENMQCDTRLCIFTCMKTLFTGFLARNNVPQSGENGRLNWCLQCDEKRCGTAFATCSGVARRRLGIETAIERNLEEICPYVGFDWDEYPFLKPLE